MVSKEDHETLTEFQAKVDRAKMEADGADLIWVETTPAICKYFNRKGMGASGYFDYQGVKVCETGQTELLQARMKKQIGEIVHGDAKVQQVESTRPSAVSVK